MTDVRKWWHTTLRLLDRQDQFKTSVSTIGSDPSANAASFIVAYRLSCMQTAIPPAAWDATESPGYFLYRPSLDDIGGLGGNNYVVPQDYDAVVAINNRFIFEYQLRVAYDFKDSGCTSTGPPNTMLPDPFDVQQDLDHGAVFLFPQIPYFDRIGCCDIHLANPGDPIQPGDVNECYRVWGILAGSPATLVSVDFSVAPDEAYIERGTIISAGSGTLNFYDATWDKRNKLWGLEENGIRQILPGLGSTHAIALNYATVTDNFGGAAVAVLFPITPRSLSNPDAFSPGMSFNNYTNKLYISANNHLFELEIVSDAKWNIVRYQSLGANSDLQDLAFDPYGNCFGIYNNNLVKVNFTTAFGSLTPITTDDSFSGFSGLDFVLNPSHITFVVLVTSDSGGNIYSVNTTTGVFAVTGWGMPVTVVGFASCLPGEDARVPVFPFDPGISPWLFMLDTSGSMNSLNRWATVVSGMEAFIRNNIRLNEEMIIATYSDSASVSPRFVFRTASDKQAAIDYINSLPVPAGDTNFCESGPFSTAFLQNYQGLNSIIAIGDGGFTSPSCPQDTTELRSYLQNVFNTAVAAGNPELVVRAVGIYPDQSGREHLGILGDVGGGGYTEWV